MNPINVILAVAGYLVMISPCLVISFSQSRPKEPQFSRMWLMVVLAGIMLILLRIIELQGLQLAIALGIAFLMGATRRYLPLKYRNIAILPNLFGWAVIVTSLFPLVES